MDPEQDRWTKLIAGLRARDETAARDFYRDYGDMLRRVAEKHLGKGMRRRVGPEDVVQSVMRTFLRRAHEGEFQLDDSAALWMLLCAITLTKVREQTRFHLRKKRGIDREVHAALPSDQSGGADRTPADPNPTPAETAEFADQLQALIATLDEEEQKVVDLKLQDCTNDEVAEKLGMSERTVRRLMKRIQTCLAAALSADQ